MAGKFELKKSKNDKYFFNLLAGNGQIILTSEMYESKASATNGIESVKKNAADDAKFGTPGRQGRLAVFHPEGRQRPGHRTEPGLFGRKRRAMPASNRCKSNAPGAAPTDDQTRSDSGAFRPVPVPEIARVRKSPYRRAFAAGLPTMKA